MTWHNAIPRQTAVMVNLAAGMRARLERHITASELDSILAECRAATVAIERDMEIAWSLSCQTAKAVREGRAEWA